MLAAMGEPTAPACAAPAGLVGTLDRHGLQGVQVVVQLGQRLGQRLAAAAQIAERLAGDLTAGACMASWDNPAEARICRVRLFICSTPSATTFCAAWTSENEIFSVTSKHLQLVVVMRSTDSKPYLAQDRPARTCVISTNTTTQRDHDRFMINAA